MYLGQEEAEDLAGKKKLFLRGILAGSLLGNSQE
jgi:hypothetical protein